ncbi:hypothetical protein [Nocardia araoensis]|uniref:hypothetical protein n=1 Tax=Nocardia araoensis TaxID=228600 RepID=UPI0005856BC8|nr:hypothetical protein [Nocardia araoensis]
MSVPGWSERLARFQAAPAEAFKHVVDEYVAVALNRNSGLFGPRKSLTDRLRRDGAHDVPALAEAQLDRCRWAVYRVRRCYTAPARAWLADSDTGSCWHSWVTTGSEPEPEIRHSRRES